MQHERAPRSCNQTTNDIIGMPIDIYSQRRLPIHHHNGFILPMHISNTNFNGFHNHLDASSGSHKYLSTMHSGLLDSFGNGIFLPPTASIFNAMNVTSIPTENLFGNSINTTGQHTYSNSVTNVLRKSSAIKTESELATKTSTGKEDEVTSSAEDIPINVIDVSGSLDSQQQPTYIENSSSFTAYSELEAVFESAAKLLFLAVKWAKSMPSFAQITLKDQMALLEESWSELFVITAAQYGLPLESITNKFILFFCVKFKCFTYKYRHFIYARSKNAEITKSD